MRRGLVVGVGLLLPSGTVGVFDGLPLDSVPEFAALTVIAVATLAQGGARAAMRPVGRPVLIAVVAVAVLKAAVLAGGTHEDFAACYRPLVGDPVAECGRAWANPLRLGGVTRFDQVIAFGSTERPVRPPAVLSKSNWNHSLFNDNRFNFYPWQAGVRVRDRLPFQASWTAIVAGDRELRLARVGEAAVTVDGQRIKLVAAYDVPRTFTFTLPPGPRELRVDLLFDDHSFTPWQGTAPYAMLRLTDAQDRAVQAVGPGTLVRTAAFAADLLLVALLLFMCTGAVLGLVRRHMRVLVLVLLAALAAARIPALLPLAPLLLALGLARSSDTSDTRGPDVPRSSGAALPFAATLLGVVVIVVLNRFVPLPDPLHTVLLRSAGDDWLTYESHARAILDQGSLWGGEDVFVYSPGFRYVLAAGRLLTGDGELLWYWLGQALLLWGGVLLVASFAPPLRELVRRWRSCLLAMAAGWFLFDWLSGSEVLYAVLLPLSEWPSWVALLLSVPLLFGEHGRRAELVAAVLLGIAATIRTEQLPALVLLLGLWWWRSRRARRAPREMAVVLLPVALIALLPMVHNLAYGGAFAPLPRTPRLPVNFPLAPADLLRLGDPPVRAVLASQAAGVVYAMPHSDEPLIPEVHRQVRAAQALWLAAVAAAIVRRRRRGNWAPLDGLLLVAPAYLLPHLFVQVYVYYPRHIVAGYLAALAAAAVTLGVPDHDITPTTVRAPIRPGIDHSVASLYPGQGES